MEVWGVKTLACLLGKEMAGMNIVPYKLSLQKALEQKNLALWSCVGLVGVNLILLVKLVNQEETWVLIPQYNTDHHFPMTASRFSDDCYIEWAGQLINSLLCVNPDSYEWKVKQVLNITSEYHGTLKEQLLQEGEKIWREDISTVFYPQEFQVNQQDKWIEVKGQHIAYFGRRSTPVETQKTFRLSWTVARHGIILLKEFHEIKQEVS